MIQDAFRDAELCTAAIEEMFHGDRSFDDAMAGYQTARDQQVLPFYGFTTQIATLEPPPPDLAHLLGGLTGDQQAMDAFVRVAGGVTSPAEFFSEANVEGILADSRAL